MIKLIVRVGHQPRNTKCAAGTSPGICRYSVSIVPSMSGSITLFMVSTTIAEYLIDKVTRSVPRRLSYPWPYMYIMYNAV